LFVLNFFKLLDYFAYLMVFVSAVFRWRFGVVVKRWFRSAKFRYAGHGSTRNDNKVGGVGLQEVARRAYNTHRTIGISLMSERPENF